MQMSLQEMLEARRGSCPQHAEGQRAWLLQGSFPINKSYFQDKDTDAKMQKYHEGVV